MSIPTVLIDLLSPTPVLLIDSRIRRIFNLIADEDQRSLVSQLEEFTEVVQADGSIPHLLRMGALTPDNMDEKHLKKGQLLQKCYWQLAQLYRYSTPSRIAEAVPAIRYVSKTSQGANLDAADAEVVVPLLYLGVALSRGRDHDDEALETLERALTMTDTRPDQYVKDVLWARAEYSRLLRRFNKTAEAEAQNIRIRSWILRHPYTIQHSELKALVSDDTDTSPNDVLTHPDLSVLFGPSNARFGGLNVGMMYSQF